MAAKRPKGNIMNYFVHANKKAKQGEYKMLQTVYYDRCFDKYHLLLMFSIKLIAKKYFDSMNCIGF